MGLRGLTVLYGWLFFIIGFCILSVGLILAPIYFMGGPGEFSKKSYNYHSLMAIGVEWAPLDGIPAHLMPHFKAAGEKYGIPWWVLAAVANIESSFRPVVTGPENYTGELAQGMMQFLPSTWKAYGVDGDGDGRADIFNPIDSIYSAANYLAANQAANKGGLRDALFLYNRSDEYVNRVLAMAEGYRLQSVWEERGYGFPIATSNPVYTSKWGDPRSGGRSHKGVDIACDVGTPLLAVANGVIRHSYSTNGGNEIWIETSDGISYFYCHLSQYIAKPGQQVKVGQPIALSGNTGISTGPHLHLGIMVNGEWINPMPFLEKARLS